MPKFVKKPIEIQAELFDGSEKSVIAIQKLSSHANIKFDNAKLEIMTLEGIMEAKVGDYVICGITGELYPCKPEIFNLTYDNVE